MRPTDWVLRPLSHPWSLATRVGLGLAAMLILGLVQGWVWTGAARDWSAHLDRAAGSGAALYAALSAPEVAPPRGLLLTPLPPGIAPPPPGPGQRETRLSILSGGGIGGVPTGGRLTLVILATQRAFPLAGLDHTGTNPAERLGELLRTMARACSDAVIFARRDGSDWVAVSGAAVWSCAARPPDRRLPVALAGLVVAALVLGALANQRAALDRVIAAMTDRFQGATGQVPVEGPSELRALAEAANGMTAREQARLAERAQLLAGISHDLGTPTTRLRLRAALIPEPDLRARFERDIAQMAEMIDAVLVHTREQMAQEGAVMVSVLSLVQSVADDFADTGAPVTLVDPEPLALTATGSLFARARPRAMADISGRVAADRRLLALCRPQALRRAVTNLVENALKYGRRAQIELVADAETITIRVRDFGGGGLSAARIADLIAPFARGPNAARTPGSGMGLAIADGIARQHGGALTHDDWAEGVIASLTLRRGG